MPKLSQREVCLGAGCLIQTCDGWRRAVVINCSQTTGIDVRFIDTGAIDVIPLDRVSFVALSAVHQIKKQKRQTKNEITKFLFHLYSSTTFYFNYNPDPSINYQLPYIM